MFHSIHQKEDPLYKIDPWSWDADDFERLCEGIKNYIDCDVLLNLTILDVVKAHNVSDF